MKTRIGFVSNSSSSSFIIAVKGTTLRKALDQLKIKDHPLSKIIDDIIDTIVSSAEETTFEDIVDDMGYESKKDYIKENRHGKDLLKLENGGFQLYTGSFSSEGEVGAEMMLCYTDLNYESDNLVIIHEGGY